VKHRTIGLVFLGCSVIGGCRPSEVASTTPAPSAARSWSEQVADVRAGRSEEIVATTERIGPAEWSQLGSGCSHLRILDVEQLNVPASELAVLSQLTELERLRVGSPVDDEAVGQIAQAASLKIVNLPAGQFTDVGLQQIATLPKLELLRFSSPDVTDQGMEHIASIETLRFLHLIDVPVTDKGISALHTMTGLESFYLDGGRCTDEALGELLRALPELHFHRDQLHLPGDPRADDHTRP